MSTPSSSTAAAEQPIPRRSPDTEFFWTAGAEGVLRILGCDDCGRLTHPPGPRCRHCRSAAVAPRDLSGRATLWSWSLVHQPFVTWLEVPYLLGIVAVAEDETVHLTTNLVAVAEDELSIGMPMTVCFEPVDWVHLPLFRPAGDHDG